MQMTHISVFRLDTATAKLNNAIGRPSRTLVSEMEDKDQYKQVHHNSVF
jgi:hypothetical protein